MTTKLPIIVLLCSMLIIMGSAKPNRRFIDDEVDDQADDTEMNDDESDDEPEDKEEEKRLMLDVFLHNFMNKLQRTIQMLEDEKLTQKFEELNEEYQERLVDDTVHTPSGFVMGDQALQMLRLANYVLDRADIREVKNKRAFKKRLSAKVHAKRGTIKKATKIKDDGSDAEMRKNLKPILITSPTTTNQPPTTLSESSTIRFSEDENYRRRRRSLNRREASPARDVQPFNPYLSETDLNSQKINQLNVEIEKASRKIDEIVELKNWAEKADAKRRRKIGK